MQKKSIKKILWAAPVCLHDTSSGAAIQMRILFEGFAKRNIECRALGAFTFDTPSGSSLFPQLKEELNKNNYTFFSFADKGIRYQYMRTDSTYLQKLTYHESGLFFLAFIEILNEFAPDIVMFYGYSPLEMSIIAECKRRNIKTCISVFNGLYKNTYFHDIDLMLTDSTALARKYFEDSKVQIKATGVCLDLNRSLVRGNRERKYISFINPVPEKGISLLIRLMLMAKKKHPDWQFLIVESRATWNEVIARYKLDKNEFTNLQIAEQTPMIAQVFALSRLVVVPSLWFESFGRVALEAVVNNIPVLASRSGGLPDTVDMGGICLDAPQKCQEDFNFLPSEEEMQEWFNALEELMDTNKESHWQEQCALAARKYDIEKNTDKAIHYLNLCLNNDKSIHPYSLEEV